MSTDLEEKIIGSCLSYEKCLDVAIDELEKKHFIEYAPVFEAIRECYKEGRDHEDILFDVQEKTGKSLVKLINVAKPSINEPVQRLKMRWIGQQAGQVSDTLHEASKDAKFDYHDISETLIQSIHTLSDTLNGETKNKQHISEVMEDSLALIEKLRSGEQLGFTSGLDIDKTLRGFQTGQFYLLAARPSQGKTALAIQIAQQVSTQTNVGFLSLETTNKSLGLRTIINHSGLDGNKVRSGYINDQQYSRIKESARQLSKLGITFDDTTDLTAEGIRAKVNKMKREDGIEFLIIDYVQLMKADGSNREREVAEISRSCVSVAKEFDICVFGIAQLSRKNENRGGDKRPIMSDLRDSGQLEQDAFAIIMLHRPEYYGIEKYPSGESTKGIAELIITKHKDGPTGIKKVLFNKESMQFRNLSKQDAPF